MAAPMFGRTTGFGHACRLCADVGRTVSGGKPVFTERLPVAGRGIDICPVCDQNPADAPDLSRGQA